jgi:hypothetical protein
MSEQAPLLGQANNGDRSRVSVGKFTGIAGIRRRPLGREVAYYGEAPSRFPVAITIGDEATEATMRIDSKVNGFAVLWVPDAI